LRLRRSRVVPPEPDTASDGLSGPHLLEENGLLARWYIELRLAEESERARRYVRPLAALAASPSVLPGERLPEEARLQAAEAAKAAARTTDLVGWTGDDRILVVMPETDAESARIAAARWRDEIWLRSRSSGGQKWDIVTFDHGEKFRNIDDVGASIAGGHKEPAA
jgi:hypothetical protein